MKSKSNSLRMTRVYSALDPRTIIGHVIWQKGALPFKLKARNTGENFPVTDADIHRLSLRGER